jgi:hypothetical protein
LLLKIKQYKLKYHNYLKTVRKNWPQIQTSSLWLNNLSSWRYPAKYEVQQFPRLLDCYFQRYKALHFTIWWPFWKIGPKSIHILMPIFGHNFGTANCCTSYLAGYLHDDKLLSHTFIISWKFATCKLGPKAFDKCVCTPKTTQVEYYDWNCYNCNNTHIRHNFISVLTLPTERSSDKTPIGQFLENKPLFIKKVMVFLRKKIFDLGRFWSTDTFVKGLGPQFACCKLSKSFKTN